MALFRLLYVSFLIGSIGLLLKEAAHAEDWGNLGYSHPTQTVEPMPDPVDDAPPAKEVVTTTASSAESPAFDPQPAVPAPDYHRSATDISTVQNTYGVETQENAPVKFYAAPFAGMTSAFGNTTTNVTPGYAAGLGAGFLLSSSFMIDASFTHGEQNMSGPLNQTTSGVVPSNVFNLKQNGFDAGARLFFLGRESRIRPFFGAGGAYVRSTLNYNSAFQTGTPQALADFNLTQVNAYGELGAEVAITKSIVATAMFKVNGVMSSTTSAQDATTAANYTSDKVTVGNSLSQSATYTIGAGLGIYF